MSSKHVGMTLALKNIIHSIKCDSSKKYDRYFCIAFLPPKEGLDSCILAGCLEVSKEGDGEFYNPSKFYSPEVMREAVIHMLAALMAFEAFRKNRDLHSVIHSTLNTLYHDPNMRRKLIELSQKYHARIKYLTEEASRGEG